MEPPLRSQIFWLSVTVLTELFQLTAFILKQNHETLWSIQYCLTGCYYPEDGARRLLKTAGNNVSDYTLSHPRRRQSLPPLSREPQSQISVMAVTVNHRAEEYEASYYVSQRCPVLN